MRNKQAGNKKVIAFTEKAAMKLNTVKMSSIVIAQKIAIKYTQRVRKTYYFSVIFL
jgi:hypothetical protein